MKLEAPGCDEGITEAPETSKYFFCRADSDSFEDFRLCGVWGLAEKRERDVLSVNDSSEP